MKKYLLTIITSVLVLLLHFSFADAQTGERQNIIAVRGEGIVKVEPDLVVVRFGVITRDSDPVKARQLNEDAAAKALGAVRNIGVAERKIKVTVLQLNEVREYDRDRRRHISIGYEAIRQIVVELNEIEKLPQLIAQVTQQGANRLFGISYDISNRAEIQNEAFKKAAANAREKASVLSNALYVTLGKVVEVREQSFYFPGPIPVRAMMADQREAAMDMGTPEAYAAGEIEVRAQVQVEFLLE